MSWLAGNLLVASLLVVAVLLLRRPVASWFGARAAYALWLAPALRLVLPPLPRPVAAPEASGGAVAWMVETSHRASETVSAFPSLWLVWAIGFAAMVAVRLVVHHRFLSTAVANGRRFESPAVAIDVIATPAVDGPVATGLIHPLILVPQDFDTRFTPEQQHFALWHEQLHHRRGDLWATAAALLVSSALWFNPFVWLALGAFRRDMESACDAALLTSAGRAAAPAYAETILRCAARPVPRSLCALTSIDELKGRLTMLNANHTIAAKLGGLMLAGGLALAGLAIAAPAAADEAKTQTKEVRTVIIEHDGKGPHEIRLDSDHPENMAANCPGVLTSVESGPSGTADKKERQKIVICSKGGSKAEAAKGLERALANIDKNDEMSAEAKADLKAKLTAKIAELRAGN